MEKTKKQRTINKLLTLVLAFVMVFTGMGIGSWGVDTAWADELPLSITDEHGAQFDMETIGFNHKIKIQDANIKVKISGLVFQISDLSLKYVFYEGQESGEHLSDFGYNEGTYTLPITPFHVDTETANRWFSNDGIKIDGTADYYVLTVDEDTDDCNQHFFIFEKSSGMTINKEPLQTAISDAEKIDSTKYHTTNDRWNGSKYSKNGFWADLQAVIDAAKAVYDNEGATQAQVDAAAKTLDRNERTVERHCKPHSSLAAQCDEVVRSVASTILDKQ